MEDLVSIVIPNRGGKNLDKVLQNIRFIYPEMNKEFIIVEQANRGPLQKGQLFNIGVKMANGKYLALSDHDILHLRNVPWIQIYKSVKKPIIGFKYISQIVYVDGKPVITSTKDTPTGFGGFNFMERNDFISFNGFSNLYFGWGYEDNAYGTRFEYVRIPQNLGHITHPISNRFDYPLNREYNKAFAKTETTRNKMEDGYLQTTFEVVSDETKNDVRYIKVDNIWVCKNFKYMDILEEQIALSNRIRIV